MSEGLEKIEREMMAMRPKGMSAGVMDHLVEEMAKKSWGDWCLAGAMGSGMAAAVVIVAMLWAQSATDVSAAPGQSTIAAGNPLRAGDYLAVYARMDGNWDGVVK